MIDNNLTYQSSSDVLIICALHDEFKALTNVANGLLQPWKEELVSGWTTATTILQTAHGDLSIRATWQGFMGREQAISQTAALMMLFPDVRCIAMCGICAGRRNKVHLGDVIFADRLWSYDSGKLITENGQQVFQGDMLQFKTHNKILQRMQNFKIPNGEWLALRPQKSLEEQEDWVISIIGKDENPLQNLDRDKQCPNWTKVIERLLERAWINEDLTLTQAGKNYASRLALFYPDSLPKSPEFAYQIAPIGTGAKVVEDGGIFPKLVEGMRKVLGVDMEASGIAALGDILNIPVVIAKGVSDYGDKYKDDNYRYFAARAAAEFLIKLLKDSADLIVPLSKTSNTQPLLLSKSPTLPLNVISELANLYPTFDSIGSVWVKAGGKRSEVENITRSEDLWLIMWQKAINGARVSPMQLLKIVLMEYPNNTIFLSYSKQSS